MFELTAENACDYLGRKARVTELGGGVSNTVLLVETGTERMVLKQSLAKLRVEQDWFSDRTRIYREADAMRKLEPLLPYEAIPEVRFEDRDNCIFGMTAAPDGAETWKAYLMRGIRTDEVGVFAAEILGDMIRGTMHNQAFEHEFGDQTVFNQLRIDPYYRSTAARHPDLAAHFEALIHESFARRCALVHGDFSPKNLLVTTEGVVLIDFEVVHYGDPSFDAAFLLNHLFLKSFYRPESLAHYEGAATRFWKPLRHRFRGCRWFEPATIQHLGALMLARIDGKSPVEYIRTEELKERVRTFARNLIVNPPATVSEAWARRAIN